jgi:hypothetical protein
VPSTGFNIPIVFLVFKRPALTARVFEQIRLARPSRLFVVADGPRRGNAVEAEQCRAVRSVIEAGIDWPVEVVRDYADENLGLAKRVSSGISRAFEHVERAIILEDDCLPDGSFFPFCAELLDRYQTDERVGQVTGCSFRSAPPVNGDSYYFSRYPHCWGWATWRRAWRQYDHGMSAWNAADRRAALLGDLESAAERAYWTHAFNATAKGRIDSWAYRWTLTCWAHGWLSVIAAHNLVSNIGYTPDATHTDTSTDLAALSTRPVSFPLHHPKHVERDHRTDQVIGERCFRRASFLHRLGRRLRAALR